MKLIYKIGIGMLLICLVAGLVTAGATSNLETVYNPFTSKLDFIDTSAFNGTYQFWAHNQTLSHNLLPGYVPNMYIDWTSNPLKNFAFIGDGDVTGSFTVALTLSAMKLTGTSNTMDIGVFSDDDLINLGIGFIDLNGNLSVDGNVTASQLQIETDDGNIKIGDVFANKVASTDTGIELSKTGQLKSGVFTEVNGEILSYAINVPQIGDRVNAEPGGIFRLDTRGAGSFAVVGYQAPTANNDEYLNIDLTTGLTTFKDTTRTRGILNDGTYGSIFYNPAGGNAVSIAGTTYGLLVDSGNVGIGTTTPTHELNVVGDGNFTRDVFIEQELNVTGNILGDRLLTQRYLGTPTTTNLISIQDTLIAYNTAMNVGGVGKFFLKNSFGGSHTPDAPVDGRMATPANKHKPQLILYDTTAMTTGVGGYNSYGGKYTAAGAYTIFAAIGGVKENAVSGEFGGALSFRTRPAGGVMTDAEHMRITSTGLIGIGTSAPTHELNVVGSTNITTDLRVEDDGVIIDDLDVGGLTTTGQGLATDSASVGGVIFTNVVRSTVGATTDETDMHTYTIPANTLGTNGDYLDVHMSGYAGNDDTGDVYVRIYFGGTLILTQNYADGDAGYWEVDFKVFRQGASDQFIIGYRNGDGGITTTYGFQDDTAIDETGAIIIKATGEKTDSLFTIYQETSTINWYPVNT